MAEEEKNGLQTEENTGETDSQTDTGTPQKKPETVDYEKRYKDLQADHTQTKQRLADLEAKAQETPAEEAPEGGDFDDEGFVDRKAVDKMIKGAVLEERKANRMERADSYFRRTYPDLVKHENIIGGILRNPKDAQSLKGASAEERIDAAVKEFNELTEEAITTAKAEAETAAKEREEKNRQATGLGGPSTTPTKSDDEGKSDAQELADRKARLAKRRSLV